MYGLPHAEMLAQKQLKRGYARKDTKKVHLPQFLNTHHLPNLLHTLR